jgi:putative ABC transport system permease protein
MLAADPGVALMHPEVLEQMISPRWYAGRRFAFLVMVLFGGAGLTLVSVGVYGVLAYTTEPETHKIGIPMALGAEPANVLGLVISKGFRSVGDGRPLGWRSVSCSGEPLRPSFGPE